MIPILIALANVLKICTHHVEMGVLQQLQVLGIGKATQHVGGNVTGSLIFQLLIPHDTLRDSFRATGGGKIESELFAVEYSTIP